MSSDRIEDLIEFAENPEPRCPCVLLVDTSASMRGAPIEALNEGLRQFKNELAADQLASRRVELAVISFDSAVELVEDFVTPDAFEPPVLEARGLTKMATGVHHALDLIEARKREYRAAGISYYRPWVFLITDGAPQGEGDSVVEQAAARIHAAEEDKRVAFFGVGVMSADMERLGRLVDRPPLRLDGLRFVELFVWLSASMQRVSQSKVDEQVLLPPAGWSAV